MRGATVPGRTAALALFATFLAVLPARAVIFYSTADTSYNTTAPTGSLAGSGWQWVGDWIGFQAVPVGPHHFLAARHIGGSVGDVFTLNGTDYVTVGYQDDTVSDLRLWQVNGTFPSWAPLYRTSDEVGRDLVVFGRGATRGADVLTAVTVNRNLPAGSLAGWQWVNGDGRLRWGQNSVAAAGNGGSYWGELLYATFDQTGGPNECHLGGGDSSGPVFINDGSGWKLAGVAAAVDGPFNNTTTGDGFNAALFDERGLYVDTAANPPPVWALETGSSPVPSGFYATRVSVRAAWIDSIAAPPEDGTPLLSGPQAVLLVIAFGAAGAFHLRAIRSMPDRTC